MVFLSSVISAVRPRKMKRIKGTFIDSMRILVQGGSGGTGTPKYGGPGGQGGCVYCIGKENARLEDVTRKFPAKRAIGTNGENSRAHKLVGSPGTDAVLEVPLGVRIYLDNEKIGEINNENDTCLLARGGPPGGPSNGFLGRQGQNRVVRLDLRLIADIGLVGFPNAGKSTLLRAVSRAKPKVASYPFTTIRPNLGIIEYPDLRQISVADLPGLVEGAHINIGMGHTFLKHVERTKLLLLVVDIQGFALSLKHKKRSCLETVLLLNRELELYDSTLLDKPALLVVNKMDTPNAEQKFNEIKHQLENLNDIETIPQEFRPEKCLKFEHIMPISAQQMLHIEEVKKRLREHLDLADEITEDESFAENIRARLAERGPTLT